MTFPAPQLPATPTEPLDGAQLPPDSGPGDSSHNGESTHGATPTPPQYLTAEQFQQAQQMLLRQLQSQLDKRDARLQRLVQGQTLPDRTAQALAKLGVKLPEGKQAQDVIAELQAQGVLPQDEPEEADLPEENAPADPVTVAGQTLAQQYGLVAGDPELQLIRAQGVTPTQYLQSIAQAGQAKQARLAAPQSTGGRGASPAAIPGLTNGGGTPPPANPIENVYSSDELYDLAYRQARQGRTGNRR